MPPLRGVTVAAAVAEQLATAQHVLPSALLPSTIDFALVDGKGWRCSLSACNRTPRVSPAYLGRSQRQVATKLWIRLLLGIQEDYRRSAVAAAAAGVGGGGGGGGSGCDRVAAASAAALGHRHLVSPSRWDELMTTAARVQILARGSPGWSMPGSPRGN